MTDDQLRRICSLKEKLAEELVEAICEDLLRAGIEVSDRTKDSMHSEICVRITI